MKRYVVSTLFFALLAAYAGAQPGTLQPRREQLAQLLKRNYGLIEKFVKGSLHLTNPKNSALERSESYDAVIRELESEIARAAEQGDGPRVSELGGHLNTVLNKGLVPNLGHARKMVSKGSPEEDRLFRMSGLATEMPRRLDEAFQKSPLANSAEAGALMKALHEARDLVDETVKPADADGRLRNNE